MFEGQAGVPSQGLWSVDGGFLPPEQLWEDARVGLEQRRIYSGSAAPARAGTGSEAGRLRGAARRRGRGLPPREGMDSVRRTRSVQGCEREERSHFPCAVQAGPDPLARRGLVCVVVGVAHTKLSGPAAPAACSDRPALLKDERSDSCPPGVSSQLSVQRTPFFLLLFTPCKEFSINKRSCFIINLMFILSPGV